MREIDQNFLNAIIKKADLNTILEHIRKGANVNIIASNGWAPIHFVTLYENTDYIEALIKANANIDAAISNEDKNGWTALHLACYYYYSKEDIVKFLVDAGANINAKNKIGITPLHLASQNDNNSRIIEYLIQHGAHIDAKTANGWTPLHWAVYYGNDNNIRTLINANADINAQNNNGGTPLSVAINRGYYEKSILLVRNGADIFIKDNQGNTPLELVKYEEWKTKIIAAYSEYQSRVALGKVETSNCNNVEYKAARKIRAI